VAVVLVFLAAMTFWHLMDSRRPWPANLKRPSISDSVQLPVAKQAFATISLKHLPPAGHAILAEDGASLRFVPGGKVALPNNRAGSLPRVVKVNPFYMDETPVTNHQYVEFLNRNLSQIATARGVVRDDEEVWLFLGEVFAGYEPIAFHNGKFKINNAPYASYPVLRVTPAGAAAYAGFYNRQLPTYAQWLAALDKDGRTRRQLSASAAVSDRQMDLEQMRRMMDRMMTGQGKTGDLQMGNSLQPLTPVIDLKPNASGIRGLNGRLREWGLQFEKADSRDKVRDAAYVMLGAAAKGSRQNLIPAPISRQPWEAFEDVGFRCVRSVRTDSIGGISNTSNPL
jgi:serine/threonine-protein kinase